MLEIAHVRRKRGFVSISCSLTRCRAVDKFPNMLLIVERLPNLSEVAKIGERRCLCQVDDASQGDMGRISVTPRDRLVVPRE